MTRFLLNAVSTFCAPFLMIMGPCASAGPVDDGTSPDTGDPPAVITPSSPDEPPGTPATPTPATPAPSTTPSAPQRPTTSTRMATASRVIGMAPLGVFFDAVSSTSAVVQPAGGDYASYQYEWDFGDDHDVTWSTTGGLRNRATGCVAAHVYEEPGTYVVLLRITTSNGQVHEYGQQITVEPFIGLTYYVSSSQGSDSNDGLTEARPFRSWEKAVSAINSGRRILFKRGDTWTTGSGVTINAAGPGVIGAYGSGNAPAINIQGTGAAIDVRASNWVFMDLDFVGPGGTSKVAGIEGRALTRNLMLRVGISRFYVGAAYSWVGAEQHDENFIVDCDVSHNVINNGYIGGQRVAVLGNHFDNADTSHLLRVWGIRKGVISENIMHDPGGDRLALKLHNEIGLKLPDAQYIIVSNNDLRGHAYVTSIAPQAWNYDERVKDVIFERNIVRSLSDTFTALVVEAQRVTVRNNIFIGDGAGPYYTGMSVAENDAPEPAAHKVYNNTIYRGENGKEFTAIKVEGDGIEVRNNLVSAAATPGAVLIVTEGGAGIAQDHNLLTNAPGFVDGAGGDFALAAGSPARDTGVATPYAKDSIHGVNRPQGSGYDIGATEQ